MKSKRKLWSWQYINILLIELCLQFGTNMIIPVLSSFSILLGSTVTLAAFVTGLNATAALLCRPFTGLNADRFNKKKLLMISATVFALSAYGCAFSAEIWQVAICRTAQGIAFALKSAVIMGLVTLVVDKAYIGRGLGWMGVCSTVSTTSAPLLGTFLSFHFSFNTCFIVAGIIFSLGLAFTLMLNNSGIRQEQSASREKVKLSLSNFFFKPGLPITFLAGLSGAPYSVCATLILVAGDARGIENVSLYFAFVSLAALISKPVGGSLIDKYGAFKVLIPTMIMMMVSCIIFAFMTSTIHVIIGAIIMGLGQGAEYASVQVMAMSKAKPEETGRASNTFYIGPDLNMGITPTIAGAVMGLTGVMGMYLFCFVLLVLAFCLVFVFVKKKIIS